MEHRERATLLLRRIGKLTSFDPEAIMSMLINEFEVLEKDVAREISKEIVDFVNEEFFETASGEKNDLDHFVKARLDKIRRSKN